MKIPNLKFQTGFVTCYLLLVICYLLFPPRVSAQDVQGVSLSITPPLVEIMAKPGKAFEQRYILKNEGAPTYVKVNIAPFTSADNYGNVNLQKNLSDFDPQSFSSWFTFTKPRMKYGGKLFLPTGEMRELIVKITPPEDASEGDYYFTITFETDYGDEVVAGNTVSKAKIGANILLTVSQNGSPVKKAKVIAFSAPRVLDALVPISYTVEIANIGNTLLKPVGKIIIRDILGKVQVLTLAPQNILASSKRIIYCLDGEKIVTCTAKTKVPFGIYQASLIFNAEGGEKIYQEETVTLVLPSAIIIALVLVVIIIEKIIGKIGKKAKAP